MGPVVNVTIFYGRNLRIPVINYSPGKPFLLSLIFAGKARSLPLSGVPEKELPSTANIRQGWKGLPVTNTLAYYENSYYGRNLRFCNKLVSVPKH